MAGYKNGFIKLDTPRDVFYPGQVVSGTINLELDQSVTLSVLYVNYIGKAEVMWEESESEVCVGREEYFNFWEMLSSKGAPVELPPGTRSFPFRYQIPFGIPSSFSGERGDVKYCVKASFELRAQTVVEQELTKYFEVVAPFNLNLGSPRLKEPIELEFEQEVCGCFCSSGSVAVQVRLPASGYCPAQAVPVAVKVENHSNIEVTQMIFQLLSRERYRTQRPVSEYVPPEKVMKTFEVGAVMSNCTKIINFSLVVPDMIAPNLENCGIIDVGYFFKAIIKFSGCNNDQEDEAEICLGFIPLNETVDSEYVHPLAQSLPVGPIPDPQTSRNPQNNPRLEEVNKQFTAPTQSSYPTGQSSYPTGQSSYPTGQSSYPTGQSSYPTGQSSYPTGQSSYPTGQSSYPTGQSSFTNTQTSASVVQVEEHYSTTGNNYQLGFTMTSSYTPGTGQVTSQSFSSTGGQPTGYVQNWLAMPQMPAMPHSNLRIDLPPVNAIAAAPTAPPPSS